VTALIHTCHAVTGLADERLARACSTCTPSTARTGVRRRSTAQLAADCAVLRWQEDPRPGWAEEQLLDHARRIEQARIQVQKWFPFGIGPVFGDLMPSPDGGGDLLQGLVDIFSGATSTLPVRMPGCPRGAVETSGCGRDAFGRLRHDACTGRFEPLPAEGVHWASWTGRVVDAVHDLLDAQLVWREVPKRHILGTGVIGPIKLLIGSGRPASYAGTASSHALYGLYGKLAPGRVMDLAGRVNAWLNSWKLPLWGAQFTPRNAYTTALQARHASLHLPDEPLTRLTLERLGTDLRIQRDLTGALLTPGWDARPVQTAPLAELLARAARSTSTAETPIWERQHAGRRIWSLDVIRTDSGLTLADLVSQPEPAPGTGHCTDLVGWVYHQLRADERKVLLYYCAVPTTWQEAADHAGHPGLGDRVRRKTQRLRREYERRLPAAGSRQRSGHSYPAAPR